MWPRKRSPSKLSSSRASNKISLKNRWVIIEIESMIGFGWNNDSGVEQLINPSRLRIKDQYE